MRTPHSTITAYSLLCLAALLAASMGCSLLTETVRFRDGSPDHRTVNGDADFDVAVPEDALDVFVPRDAVEAAIPDARDGQSSCGAPTVLCNGVCVDTATDPLNCGHCMSVCPGFGAARAVCRGGQCGLECPVGFADCNADGRDGCETNLLDNNHCGRCRNACSGATPVCSSPDPGSFACGTGCAGATPMRCSGMCVNTMTDPRNCGACGRGCATTGPIGTVPTCIAGVCGVACVPGRGNCNDNLIDGCETDITADRSHCGSCLDVCATSDICVSGLCTTVRCMAPSVPCGGRCVDTSSDPSNCGACSRACPTLAVCVGGACMSPCPAGTMRCGAACANVLSDPMNCGACGMTCAGGTSCVLGMCRLICTIGLMPCGGSCVDTSLDPANCGRCGMSCATGVPCVAGSCPTCGFRGLPCCAPGVCATGTCMLTRCM